MANDTDTQADKRQRLEDSIADVIEGSAPEELLELATEDDGARDLVYDAQRVVDLVQEAAADHVVDVEALERRVLEAIDARESPEPANGDAGDASASTAEPSPDPAKQTEAAPQPAGAPKPLAEDDPPADSPSSEPTLGERLGSRGRLVAAIGGLAVAAAVAWVALHPAGGPKGTTSAWEGKVAEVSRAFDGGTGLERCSPDGDLCRTIERGSAIPAGSLVRTDGQTRAMLDLDDGTTIVLDRATEVVLDADEPRQARLNRGGLVADVEHTEGARALFHVPLGTAEVIGTKFSLRAFDDFVRLDVSRGSVRLSDRLDRSVTVHAGESGELRPDEPPTASAIAALDDALGWSEHAFGADDDQALAAPGLGELRAKKPGEDKERKDAVVLSDHSVKVRIVGNVARTEIEEVFENRTDEVLEGIYRFPMPPDAKIERLALDVDGKLEDGAFVDRDRAAKIWRGAIVNAADKPPPVKEEIIWVPGPWKDPALLEWQRGGRFELRVFPIPKRGSRRVVIAYTQTIAPAGDSRRFVYPLPHDPGQTTKVGRFSVDVELRGHDRQFGVRPIGYELDSGRADDGVARFSMTARDFAPSGDLAIEYALPNRKSPITAWTYEPGSAGTAAESGGFVALALRPELPRWTENRRRTFAVVVDSSRSMIGERYQRAADLAARIVREMDRHDQVTVLACDTTCRQKPGGVESPGPRTAEDVRAFLESITPEGGSDVAEAVRLAAEAAGRARDSALRVIYIGDGTPTVGAIEPGFIREEVASAVPSESGTVTAVALGADADRSALDAAVVAGGGVVIPYAPGERASDVAYAVLGATYGTALRDARIELPPGLEEVLPRRLPTFVAGGETIVVARMRDRKVSGPVRLSGRVGSQPFEASYPVDLELTAAKGNAFVPRLFAAAKIADLEGYTDAESREETVRLSQKYQVASRYTSLLVLESPAMFRAFGLDNSPKAELWTGESDSVASADLGPAGGADDALNPWEAEAFGDGLSDAAKSKSSSGYGGIGTGRGAASPAPTVTRRSAPAPKKAARRPMRASESSSWPGAVERKEDSPLAGQAPLEERERDWDERPAPPAAIAAPEPVMPPQRQWVPMRKVWDRVGSVVADRSPKDVKDAAMREAEQAASGDARSRDAMFRLYTLYMRAGDIEGAGRTAERWSEKDPLDPDALTARADVAAAEGDRERAIRILGSVVDVRPGDHKAQWRLARLHRWAGRPKMGCRNSMAVAQIRRDDEKLLAEAVRCARGAGDDRLAGRLLDAAGDATRSAANRLLSTEPAESSDVLNGDLRLEATWDGSADLDLAMVHPGGHRVSWLGAPTRSVITANDVLSPTREGLSLRGAEPGEYVLEVTRSSPGDRSIRGTVRVTAGKVTRELPFELTGERVRFGIAKIWMQSRLVPL